MFGWSFSGLRDALSPSKRNQRCASAVVETQPVQTRPIGTQMVRTPPAQIPVCALIDARPTPSMANGFLPPHLRRQSSVRDGRLFTPSMTLDRAGVSVMRQADMNDNPGRELPGSSLNSPFDSPLDSPGGSLPTSRMSSPYVTFPANQSPARRILKSVQHEEAWRARTKADPFTTHALPVAKLNMGVEVEIPRPHSNTLAHLYDESSEGEHFVEDSSLPSTPLKVKLQIPTRTSSRSSMNSYHARTKRDPSESRPSSSNQTDDLDMSLWEGVRARREAVAREEKGGIQRASEIASGDIVLGLFG